MNDVDKLMRLFLVHDIAQDKALEVVGYLRREKLVLVNEEWRDRMSLLESAIEEVVRGVMDNG